MGGPELVYILMTLAVWGAIVGSIVYAVRRSSARSRRRDEQLRSLEEKVDRLLEDRTR